MRQTKSIVSAGALSALVLVVVAALSARTGSADEPSAPTSVETAVRSLTAANARLRGEVAAARRRVSAVAAELASVRSVAAAARGPVVTGVWEHSVDGRPAWPIELRDDGTLRDAAGEQTGTWTRAGAALVLRWPNPGAPGGGEWIDSLVVSADGSSYVGMNQLRSVIRGQRPR